MEYFNTHKNILFNLVTRIINQSVEGKNFTEEEIEKLIRETKLVNNDFIQNILDYGDHPYNIMSYDFKPFFNEDSIRINPTILEKRWLKSLINEKLNKLGENRFFLSNFNKYEKIIKLRIYHGKNVFERVHLLFANYHKKTYRQDDKQYMDISYYGFDEENVIRDVLSLGVLVEVVEPDYIRKKILEILRKGEKLDSLHRVKTYDK